jgi:hypothetical protein
VSDNPAPPSAPLADRLEQVRRFLDGSMPHDGIWFGERHPDKQGAFWWRSALLPVLDEAAAALRAAEQDAARLREALDQVSALRGQTVFSRESAKMEGAATAFNQAADIADAARKPDGCGCTYEVGGGGCPGNGECRKEAGDE